MLPIAEALEMEAFALATVVAGHGGLHKTIQWVHMADFPEMAEWAQEGELYFTTAFGLKDNPDLQADLIPELVERGVVGMVVGVGRYFHDIPAVMIDCADELDFPIVKVPWEVPFIDVTRAISERIVQQRYRLMQQSLQIHNTLTGLVLMGEDLDALARALADLVRSAVTIEDAAFRVLAHAPGGEIDEARRESIRQGGTPANLLDELESQGILGELQRSLHPIRVPPLPDLGLTLERMVGPIVVGRQIHGYVWLIVDGREIDELDTVALEHATTVAALILLKERAVYEAEQRLKGALLDDLLEGKPGVGNQLAASARDLGHSLSRSQQIVIFRQIDDTAALPLLSRWMERSLAQRRRPGLLIERSGDLVLLLPSEQTVEGVNLARQLRKEGNEQGYRFSAGIGRIRPNWEYLSESYAEAREALELGPVLHEEGITSFDDLGLFHWLHHLPAEARDNNRFSQVIHTLAESEVARRSDLFPTLEVYLDVGRNMQEAARQLFVHRNTLRQRLTRIEELCNLDLGDALTCLNLHVALKEQKLRPGL
jgi:purine catabolism regulator